MTDIMHLIISHDYSSLYFSMLPIAFFLPVQIAIIQIQRAGNNALSSYPSVWLRDG
jgi:hypothetical protein